MTRPMKNHLKKRHTWQLGLLPTDDPLRLALTVPADTPDFYGLDLMVLPSGCVPVEYLKNGEPWRDHLGRPLDGDFFKKRKVPDALKSSDVDILPLARNGIQIVFRAGDAVSIRARRTRDDLPEKWHAVIIGFVEES